ncbi:MAG: arsenate reductase ArsC [Chloroflexi bacterium]|nr:arsenate reductase ArsC [Chloroflexota bacterium]
MNKVLFVCVHNSGRSQMAEALFNCYAAGVAQAFSTGTQPASYVNRTVADAMREVGIDLSSQGPKLLAPKMLENAEKVVTMGCGVEGVCAAAFVPTEEWKLEDPEGKPIEKVRKIRDEIAVRAKKLIEEIQQQGGRDYGQALSSASIILAMEIKGKC